VKLWRPYLFLMVLDPSNPDFKSSARENIPLADAFVLRSPVNPSDTSPNAIAAIAKPKFLQPLGSAFPAELYRYFTGSFS